MFLAEFHSTSTCAAASESRVILQQRRHVKDAISALSASHMQPLSSLAAINIGAGPCVKSRKTNRRLSWIPSASWMPRQQIASS